MQVYRFPNSLCTDNGRAINQMEKGWEKTLTGIPKEIYQLWSDYLQPRGYRIRYQIIDFPGGVPGDISITIAWGARSVPAFDLHTAETLRMAKDDAAHEDEAQGL